MSQIPIVYQEKCLYFKSLYKKKPRTCVISEPLELYYIYVSVIDHIFLV